MRTDYVDLYLVHWPSPGRGRYLEAWSALEEIAASGRARSIGVSNFLPEHLQNVMSNGSRMPSVNQIELHPRFQQREVPALGARNGIATEAYSPLAQDAAHTIPSIRETAERLGRTPTQIVLRWHLQRGTIVIPKTVHRERMSENLTTAEFALDDATMAMITALENGDQQRPGGTRRRPDSRVHVTARPAAASGESRHP